MNTPKSQLVLGIGDAIVDLSIQLSHDQLAEITNRSGVVTHITHQEQEEIINKSSQKVIMARGGMAANTVTTLGRLGVKVALCGKVGLDMHGQYFCQEFCQNGGELDRLVFTQDEATSCCLSLITPDAQRTMFSALTRMQPHDWPTNLFEKCSFAHIEGFVMLYPEFEDILKQAKANSVKISLDLSDAKLVEKVLDKLPYWLENYIDIVFANQDEADAFCGKKTPLEQLNELSELCEIAVVKLGKDGCVAKNSNGEVTIAKGVEVAPVDTTAAGDTFQSGFLYGYLNNQSLATCAKFGNLLGSEVTKVVGTQIPADRWEKIVEELKFID